VFLSEQEIREMAASRIQFGAHTRTHPQLTWLDDAELLAEVAGSKADVARLIGTDDIWFAYPDGVFGHREMEIARDAGFRGAVQTWRYPWRRGTYSVPRVALTNSTVQGSLPHPHPARLEMTLAGLSTWAIRSLWWKDFP
jgi:peptidoglycan/xylan/chitin deacetylase (PgdA/CDA1 family)